MAKNVKKNPQRSSDNTANVAGAVASRNPKAALSTSPELNNFYHSRKRLYFRKIV